MKLNNKKLAALLTLIVAILGAVATYLKDPAVNADAVLPPVELPVVDAGVSDAGL